MEKTGADQQRVKKSLSAMKRKLELLYNATKNGQREALVSSRARVAMDVRCTLSNLPLALYFPIQLDSSGYSDRLFVRIGS